ncbi:malonate--CoA ligase ACSF3, mitochondrial-like [Centruroides vittatus]|uniref:malonate--CoA ligase ACSF3, mitochondrial-like n=1 Tax=Centruroides vittatus TaxID=120091 RepID=UPI00350F3391
MRFIPKLTRNHYWIYFNNFRNKCHFRNSHSFALFPPFIPIYNRSLEFANRLAVVDHYGQYNYGEIFKHSKALTEKLLNVLTNENKEVQKRISFLCQNDVSYVIAQWACWMSGHVAVPLSNVDPVPRLQYYIENSESSVIVTTEEFVEKLNPISEALSLPMLLMTHPRKSGDQFEEIPELKNNLNYVIKEYKKIMDKNAMILYTSGTTGSPKGVVLTHKNLHCCMCTLIDAWEWKKTDVILHTLPLHHTHGIVNALMCPLYVGACCVMLPKFNKTEVWDYLLNTLNKIPRINIFMAVPTIYVKLIEEFDEQFPKNKYFSHSREYIKAVCKKDIRLMVSGSASLSKPILERWEEITGHRLLERYGMTEIGMALSNPLHGNRKPNFVGTPLKGVKVRIVKDNPSKVGYDVIVEGDYKKTNIIKNPSDEIGELQVMSGSVFKEYWNKPDETKKTFTSDGWFKTGDTSVYKDGAYRILGRTSVDIIKSGGYKISALDIESHLLTHPNIKECAVLGLPDITWGEKVAAVLVTENGEEINTYDLKEWCKDKLPTYLIPSEVRCVPEIQRNAMGKINKKDLIKIIFPKVLN